MIGQTLSHFKITAKLGEGGMGEVYRAEDTKLGREVAIKVLPEAVAADPERLARFEREAKVLAALDHSNIAAIYGLEEAEGRQLLVMQLVEGDDLSACIRRGALGRDEAIAVALQIASALEAAHEKGIVHRDLKPANVMLGTDGSVKVLDFGLAKALEGEGSEGSAPGLTQSPTLTAQMTQAGVLLGTAGYMSPEQARGQEADKRSDIWAFGVVLMEMLTGETVYKGGTVSDTLASVLAREPKWESLPADTPASLRRLLHRCLDKDVRNRLRDIGDARIELKEIDAGDTGAVREAGGHPVRRLLALAATLGVGLALGALLLGWLGAGTATERSAPRATRLSIVVPDGQIVTRVLLSPDGETLLYRADSMAATGDSVPQLYQRGLDEFQSTLVPESENAAWASFSPDSRRIVYQTEDPDGTSTLKKVSLDGGPVVELLELQVPPGQASASWWSDDEIVISLDRGRTIARLPADGGEPREILTLEPEEFLWNVDVVHGGRTLLLGLMELHGGEVSFRNDALNLESGERRVIIENGLGGPIQGRDNWCLIWRDYTWFVAPFDPEKLAITGPETPLFLNRRTTISATGIMAYIPRYTSTESVVSVDRRGKVDVLAEEIDGQVKRLSWSPDGAQIALVTQDTDQVRRRLSRLDVARNSLVSLPSGDGWKGSVSWTPTGNSVTVTILNADGAYDIFRRGPRPGDALEPIFRDGPPQNSVWDGVWSPDGSVMAFLSVEQGGPAALWLLPVGEGAEPRPFLESPASILSPAISPDGMWIAFSSAEAGVQEVYAVSLASDSPGQEMVRVSDQGGTDPVWSPDGTELFFRDLDGHLMTAPVVTTQRVGVPAFGRPEVLLDLQALDLVTDDYRCYDISPDGNRFVFGRRQEEAGAGSQIYVVLDWFSELDRLGSS